MARIRIATYNINGIRARLGALLEWLERERPDVVCLQELKAPDEAFPAGDIEALGYGALWQGQKSWNGVAILARGAQPGERRRGLPGGEGDPQSRYLEATVHGLVVGCLYLPNGNPWPGPKFDYKLDWFERLIRHARGLLREGVPAVLAGDFNVVPTDELDIYDPKSWRKDALLQPESREAYVRLLDQGWTDALRTVAGEAKVFTFWDYFRRHWERDAGLRIDHLLLSPALAPLLADAGVDRWVRGRPGASDHAPTWVELDAGGAGGAGARAATGVRTVDAARAGGPKPRSTDGRSKPAASTPEATPAKAGATSAKAGVANAKAKAKARSKAKQTLTSETAGPTSATRKTPAKPKSRTATAEAKATARKPTASTVKPAAKAQASKVAGLKPKETARTPSSMAKKARPRK